MTYMVLPTGGGPDGIAQIFVSAGLKMSTSFYTLHHQRSVFGDDVDTFNPDRRNNVSPGTWEFMAFSHGPRSCAGLQKALGEAAYIIARLADKYDRIESRDMRPWTKEVKLVVKNLYGCKVALYPSYKNRATD